MIKGFISQVMFGNVHKGPFLGVHGVHVVHEDWFGRDVRGPPPRELWSQRRGSYMSRNRDVLSCSVMSDSLRPHGL